MSDAGALCTQGNPHGEYACPFPAGSGCRARRSIPFIRSRSKSEPKSPHYRSDLPRSSARSTSGPAWSHWDRELIAKVSQDSRIPAELIESVETSGHSWLDDLLNGIAGRVDNMAVFHRIREAVQAVAQSGHSILIGHGSAYFTRDLPGGLHVRLIAPMPVRVSHVAKRFSLTPREAARHIRRIDRQRQGFFSEFGMHNTLAADTFSAVLNTGELDENRIIHAIVAMLPRPAERG